MIKKLKYLLKNYYKLVYLVEHLKEIQYLVDYLEDFKSMDKDIYELKKKVEELENIKRGTKRYSIAGVPKGQKDYVVGLLKKDDSNSLENKMRSNLEKGSDI